MLIYSCHCACVCVHVHTCTSTCMYTHIYAHVQKPEDDVVCPVFLWIRFRTEAGAGRWPAILSSAVCAFTFWPLSRDWVVFHALSGDWVVFHALSLVSLDAFLNKHWLLGTAFLKKYLFKSFLLGCLLLSNLRDCLLMWLLCQVCGLWLSPTLRKTSGLVVWLKMPGRSGVYIASSWRVSVEDTWENEEEQPTLTLLRMTSQAREQHEQRLQGGWSRHVWVHRASHGVIEGRGAGKEQR